MSKLRFFVSATIVLFLLPAAGASPTYEAPASPETKEAWPESPSNENLSIAEPPALGASDNLPKVSDPGYYAYRQALTMRAGQAMETSEEDSGGNVLGFQYLFPKFLSPKLEAGADVHEHGYGHLHAGLRYFWWEREYFRPSYKLAVDHRLDAKENLATFAHLDNYYFRVSGTLEYVFKNPWSVRLEPELLANLKNQQLVVTLGFSRGW